MAVAQAQVQLKGTSWNSQMASGYSYGEGSYQLPQNSKESLASGEKTEMRIRRA